LASFTVFIIFDFSFSFFHGQPPLFYALFQPYLGEPIDYLFGPEDEINLISISSLGLNENLLQNISSPILVKKIINFTKQKQSYYFPSPLNIVESSDFPEISINFYNKNFFRVGSIKINETTKGIFFRVQSNLSYKNQKVRFYLLNQSFRIFLIENILGEIIKYQIKNPEDENLINSKILAFGESCSFF
jgi:hypothetical protein